LVLPVVLAAALFFGPLLGSEAPLAVRLQEHWAPVALVDLVVVLLAHLRVQVDLTMALQQVGRWDWTGITCLICGRRWTSEA
jgi:hypothetical protein